MWCLNSFSTFQAKYLNEPWILQPSTTDVLQRLSPLIPWHSQKYPISLIICNFTPFPNISKFSSLISSKLKDTLDSFISCLCLHGSLFYSHDNLHHHQLINWFLCVCINTSLDDVLRETRDSVWSFMSYIFNSGHGEGTRETFIELHWILSESKVLG